MAKISYKTYKMNSIIHSNGKQKEIGCPKKNFAVEVLKAEGINFRTIFIVKD